ncbi:MAG: hypothetical protein AABW51_01575 [Nanoarchaeota archaeon]
MLKREILKGDMSKTEVEAFLKGKGDFVQIDHLSRMVKERDLATDKKKFLYQKLAELYDKKGMFVEAAKMYNNISILSTTFKEKINAHMKEVEFYVKGGDLMMLDEALKKALGEAQLKEREGIFSAVKDFCKRQAEVYVKERRRANAIKLYEKLLQMRLSEAERQDIKSKLMSLYEQTGKIKEYFTLKENKTESRARTEQKRTERSVKPEYTDSFDLNKELGL